MRIFVNDTPVIISLKEKFQKLHFDNVINSKKEKITARQLVNNLLIKNATEDDIKNIFKILNDNPFSRIHSIIVLADPVIVKEFLFKYFKLIDAAGGLVKKRNKFLMIYRLKKWDLPKGKVEKSESFKAAATREVEEECNIQVNLVSKICTTYHTYTLKGNRILKRTKWYEMSISDDTKMKPQKSEDIEEVRWMNHKEIFHALKDSYRSLGYVFDRYLKTRKNGIK